jgi:RecA/RadA recombinase
MVCDSIAAAIPKSMLFDAKTGKRKEIDEFTMNDTTALARVTSTTLKAVNQLVGETDVTAIYLNQIRTKPGVVYGDPTTTPGGSAMEFYATTRIFTGRKKIMEGTGADKEFKGNLIGMETKKNKVTRPFQSVDLRLMYDEDGRAIFDFTTGYIEELIAAKKLEEKAGRVTWDGKTYWKAQLAKKINDEGLVPELMKLYLA